MLVDDSAAVRVVVVKRVAAPQPGEIRLQAYDSQDLVATHWTCDDFSRRKNTAGQVRYEL
ncbi:hypothetical protein GOEFS_054_00190 [Gordonia effusa NBRC 100432]|uniref:Uncharacterized protein n=1 Tax=Gordonia effusa NBRC 100432 TaxID=1077974 RepID=H0R005_9ACTN|nr:hypothetical protein [Gordonia effusa]GAB18406.1 hypothetical protein GOEFS_054_00190 [Gordonia effusa NBRC 100432]